MITPLIGTAISIFTYDTSDLWALLKGMILFAILVLLIPINVMCIKHGFILTGKSAKGTFDEAKKLINEKKEEIEKYKKDNTKENRPG